MTGEHCEIQGKIIVKCLTCWRSFTQSGEGYGAPISAKRFFLLPDETFCTISYHLYNLKTWKKLKVSTCNITKSRPLHGCFSFILKRTNGTKLCKTSQITSICWPLKGQVITATGSTFLWWRFTYYALQM